MRSFCYCSFMKMCNVNCQANQVIPRKGSCRNLDHWHQQRFFFLLKTVFFYWTLIFDLHACTAIQGPLLLHISATYLTMKRTAQDQIGISVSWMALRQRNSKARKIQPVFSRLPLGLFEQDIIIDDWLERPVLSWEKCQGSLTQVQCHGTVICCCWDLMRLTIAWGPKFRVPTDRPMADG